MPARGGPSPFPTVAGRYEALVSSGQLRADPAQPAVVAALDRVNRDIHEKRLALKSSALGWLFARRRVSAAPVRGLYVHGGVGRGKTMLMDMFFAVVPAKRKRRVHFNAFMADVHDRIQKHRLARKEGTVKEDDPIAPVAKALADEAWVLCFDEFAVTDIADAMILSRLFSALFAQGVVLVATSNVAPGELYRDGLNRGLFEPFIAMLEASCQVLEMRSDTDYRQETLKFMPVYLTPLSAETDRRMDMAWDALSGGKRGAPAEIRLKGRAVPIPVAAGEAARFSFADLCERPLGARDYLAIADRFSTLMIDHVPVLKAERRNEAKRFILLIDTLYDRHVRLIVSAEAGPEELYQARTGTEAFEFQRTASRLVEMQGEAWMEDWNCRHKERATMDSGTS